MNDFCLKRGEGFGLSGTYTSVQNLLLYLPPPPGAYRQRWKEGRRNGKKLKKKETVRWLLRYIAPYLQSSMSLSSIFIMSTATLDMSSLSFWFAILAS